MTLKPLLTTNVNFNYLNARKLDFQGYRTDQAAAFLGILGDGDTFCVLRSKTNLEHVFFGFLIEDISYPSFLSRFHIGVTQLDNSYIVSGTLFNFYNLILFTCVESAPFEDRFLCNLIYLFLVQQGLEDIFSGYSKRKLDDGSFVIYGTV